MAEAMGKPTKLEDIVNYQPPQRITDEDLSIIRSTFKDNDKLIMAMRRVLLPSIFDAETPPEFVGTDRWMDLDFGIMPSEQVKPIVLARQYAIKYICGGLIQLKVIANQMTETAAESALRRKTDSSK